MTKKILKYLGAVVLGMTVIGSAYAIRTDTNPFYLDSNGINWITNDTTYQLGSSAARIAKGWFTAIDTTSISIGGVTPFATGSVVFIDGGGALAQDNSNFFWDDTNNRLGIGTTTPNSLLSLGGANGEMSIDRTGGLDSFIQLSSGGAISGQLRHIAANVLGISDSNGNDKVAFNTSTGNVGIGTTTPAYKLVVNDSASPLIMVNDSTNGVQTYMASGDSLGYVGTNSNSTLAFVIAGAEKMRLDTSGRLGIGTTTPITKLQVRDAANTYSGFFSGVGGLLGVGLGTQTGNVPAIQGISEGGVAQNLAINASGGNVGIGTTTPSTNLHVTTSSPNATSTLTLGKAGQTKGSCLELYDAGGTAVYAYVAAGATTFTLSATSCK